MKSEILIGDALSQLKMMDDQSVHCVITSPPYWGLRQYHGDTGMIGLEPTWDEHLAGLMAVFDEVWRVLRKDGTIFVNYGDAYWGGKGQSGRRDPENQELRNAKGLSINKAHQQIGGAGLTAPRDGKDNRWSSKSLMMMPARFALAMQERGWILRSEIVWAKKNCLSGGTHMYARTKKGQGVHMLRDLARLDPETVELWNGQKWTRVIAWTRTGRPVERPLELQLRNGEWIGCTVDHLWPTRRGLLHANELKVGDVLDTCTLPDAERKRPAWISRDALWFAGLYLAEGSHSGDTIQLAGHMKETGRWKRIRKLCRHYGGSCHLYNYKGNAQRINVVSKALDAVLKTILTGKTAHDKHLGLTVWEWRNRDLKHILDGYLEGDGHWDAKNSRWRLGFTRNDHLCQDIRCLAARLGARAKIRKSHAFSNGKKYKTYRGELRFEYGNHPNMKNPGEIMSIGYSRARNFYDLTVADEPNLFALASGVLSHNCMPESATDRPTCAHEKVFMFARQKSYYYDHIAVRTQEKESSNKLWPGIGIKHANERNRGESSKPMQVNPGANMRNVLHLASSPYKGAHFATYPPALIEPFIKAGTSAHGVCPHCGAPWERIVSRAVPPDEVFTNCYEPEDGLVKTASAKKGKKRGSGRKLQKWREENPDRTTGWQPTCSCPDNVPVPATVMDIFAGSGTTGVVANRLGRDALLIEISQDYADMARKRLDEDRFHALNYQKNLLDEIGV